MIIFIKKVKHRILSWIEYWVLVIEDEFKDFMYNVQRVSKMTQFKLRTEWWEGASDEYIWKKKILSRGTAIGMALRKKVG